MSLSSPRKSVADESFVNYLLEIPFILPSLSELIELIAAGSDESRRFPVKWKLINDGLMSTDVSRLLLA